MFRNDQVMAIEAATVLSRIADHPIKRIEELLPWNVAASLELPNQEAA